MSIRIHAIGMSRIAMPLLARAVAALLLVTSSAAAQSAPGRPQRADTAGPQIVAPPRQAPRPQRAAIGRNLGSATRAPVAVEPMKPASPPPAKVGPAADSARAAAAAKLAPAAPRVPSGPPPRPTTASTPAASRAVAVPVGPPPADATMRCKDGTYLSGTPSPDRCATNGGVAANFTQRPAPPAPLPHKG